MKTLRQQLEPRIRQAGLRRVANLSGVGASTICVWLRNAQNRRLGSEQLEAIAKAVDCEITITQKEI